MSAPVSTRFLKFIAALRGEGFVIGPREASDALSLIAHNEPELSAVRTRLKVLLSMNRDQWDRFDGLFDAHWFPKPEPRPVSEWEAAASIIAMSSPSIAGQTQLDEGGAVQEESGRQAQASGEIELSSASTAESNRRAPQS